MVEMRTFPVTKNTRVLGFVAKFLLQYHIGAWALDVEETLVHVNATGLSKDDPDCESKARELTEQWIDTIMKLSTKPKEKMDDDGRYEKWLIRLAEGKIRLTIDKRLNSRTELITGNNTLTTGDDRTRLQALSLINYWYKYIMDLTTNYRCYQVCSN